MPDKALAEHIRHLGDLDLCPFCGACSPRSCDIEEETGGFCPWEELGDDDE